MNNIWYDSGLGTILCFFGIIGLAKIYYYSKRKISLFFKQRKSSAGSLREDSSEPELRKIDNNYILS